MAPSLPPAPHGLLVRVDATLRPLIPAFLQRVRTDIVGCRVALTTGRYSQLKALCHKNKGCCAMYGFVSLSRHFAALERCFPDARPLRRGGQRVGGESLAAMTALETYASQLHITYH